MIEFFGTAAAIATRSNRVLPPETIGPRPVVVSRAPVAFNASFSPSKIYYTWKVWAKWTSSTLTCVPRHPR